MADHTPAIDDYESLQEMETRHAAELEPLRLETRRMLARHAAEAVTRQAAYRAHLAEKKRIKAWRAGRME